MTDKIKRSVMINEYPEGGLKMIDISSFNKIIKGYLAKEIYGRSHGKGKIFFNLELDEYGGIFENINSFSFYMATDRRLLVPMPCVYLVFLVCFHLYKILSFGHEWYCHCTQMCGYLGCHFSAPIFFGYQSIPRLGPGRNVLSGHTPCFLVAETCKCQSQH